MLCTQMRLAERRISMPHDNRSSILPLPESSSRIVQRPCKNLETNSTNSNAVNKNKGNDSSVDFLTPRLIKNCSKRNDKQKPPLIVFSLKIQSDAKTLAQEDVKRDPRRLPFFCEQYKQNKKDQQRNNCLTACNLLSSSSPSTTSNKNPNENDLMVRGVEMLADLNQQNSMQNNDTTNDQQLSLDDHNSELFSNKYFQFFGDTLNADFNFEKDIFPKELMKIQLTDCCQCMRDVKFFKKDGHINKDAMNDFRNHHQPQDNRFLTVVNGQINGRTCGSPGFVNSLKQSSQFYGNSRSVKKVPSPRTRQIINITMNSRK